uniref:Headcase domain-containing protein n=1 Tax=Anopheles dirus TaxID=7168 RepID=A0A182N6K0_9DIPT
MKCSEEKCTAKAIEDEGNHGNDETRLFILSSLAAQHKSRVACVLCEEPMLVFDRYPLVDGTFFLSPKQHTKGCIEVKYENRVQYLTSVCMACLEGVEPNRTVRCRFCVKKWDGSSLVLGTMYSYDIFAAMPCCTERLKCNNCFKLMLSPHQRLNFYSDYSHSVSCPYCSAQDNHFVKPLVYCYTKQPTQFFQHVNGACPADVTGRQEQQSPFNGSSASCTASSSSAAPNALAVEKASASDSAAMNTFIQELRHLSNSSTISNISSTSNDSGFSTSYCGDSNVGSGRAPATNGNNMQQQQQQQQQILMNPNVNQHQINYKQSATGAMPKIESTMTPALSNIIWGNKSLWGPAPPSPASPAMTAAALVSPAKPPLALPSAGTTNPTSNALYTSLSKELYTPWATPTTANGGSQPTPMGGPPQMHQLPSDSSSSSIIMTSQLGDQTILPKISAPSTFNNGNNGTTIWESKLGLIGGPQQCLEPLESIWLAPEPPAAPSDVNGGAVAGGQTAWQCDLVPTGGTREPSVGGSQFLRQQESLGGGGEPIDTTPKLSSLWIQTPWSTAGSGGVGPGNAMGDGSNISVLRSLRTGGNNNATYLPSSIAADAGTVGVGGTDKLDVTTASNNNNHNNISSMTMLSEDVMSYLNIFN